ncbi:MAG: hypothetical protein R3B13_12945 [Polyangiaceae bacterium]
MSRDGDVAFFVVASRKPVDAHTVKLVPFRGSDVNCDLAVNWELELPDAVTFTAPDVALLAGRDGLPNAEQWPVFSRRVMAVLEGLGAFPHRTVSVTVEDEAGGSALRDHFVAVHLSTHDVHFDREHAIFETNEDDPDEIEEVTRWRFEVPPSGLPPLFRVAEHDVNVFVSKAAKEALEPLGLDGLELIALDDFSPRPVPMEPRQGSAASTETETEITFHERPVTHDVLTDLAQSMALAAEILDEDPVHPDEGIRRVHAEIDRYLAEGTIRAPWDLDDYAAGLAAFWGQCLVAATNWELVLIDVAGETTVAVVSPDRAHAVFPFTYLPEILERQKGNTSALLFNMIKAGQLPESVPHAYAQLG